MTDLLVTACKHFRKFSVADSNRSHDLRELDWARINAYWSQCRARIRHERWLEQCFLVMSLYSTTLSVSDQLSRSIPANDIRQVSLVWHCTTTNLFFFCFFVVGDVCVELLQYRNTERLSFNLQTVRLIQSILRASDRRDFDRDQPPRLDENFCPWSEKKELYAHHGRSVLTFRSHYSTWFCRMKA